MLIPLKEDGEKKSVKDMTDEERKDFKSAEARATSEKSRKITLNKHPGLRNAKSDSGTSTKKAKAK